MSAPALVDTHCHLDFTVFEADRAEVVERAREAGVVRIINPGIDLPTSEFAVNLASRFVEVYAAVGVHPNEVLSVGEFREESFTTLLEDEKVVAIGEIGLDYYWQTTPAELQRRTFAAQLELAAQRGLPVIVHNRDAIQDVLSMLRDWQSDWRKNHPDLSKHAGVLHSFSGTIEEAEQAVDMGFLIGITGPVTYKKAFRLQHLVTVLPLECLLVETDAPFMTPLPFRGKRNEPSYVRFTASKIAEVRGIDFEQVAEVTTANARRLFFRRESF